MTKENYLIPVIGFDNVIIKEGKGSYVYDVNDKEYIDLNSGQFCTVFGHCNEEIDDVVIQNIKNIAHTSTSMLTENVVKLSKKINNITKDIDGHSIILSTGAEAVEFCIRYAKALTKKEGLVCFDVGYHGLTLGTQSVTYSGVYAIPRVPSIYPFPVPKNFIDEAQTQKYINMFAEMIEKNHENIAAVLFEPIVSVGGMILPPKEFFKSVREICDKYRIMLIFDECQTGFARTGSWFAYQGLEVMPDLIATAKGVGSGYPISRVIMNGKHIPTEGILPITHYSSHQNDSFAASVILAGINYIEKYDMLQKIKDNGNLFLNLLKDFEQRCEYVKDARGLGLMMGLDFYHKSINNYRYFYKDIHKILLDKGVIIQTTNGGKTLRFLPDYLMDVECFSKAINILEKELNSIDWGKYVN